MLNMSLSAFDSCECEYGTSCKVKEASASGIACKVCDLKFHHRCLGLVEGKDGKIARNINTMAANFVCDRCIEVSRKNLSSANSVAQAIEKGLEKASQRLNDRFDALESRIIETVVAADTESVANASDGPSHPPTYAEKVKKKGTARAARPQIAKEIVAEIQKEESLSRSIVVSGMAERGSDMDDITSLLRIIEPSTEPCQVVSCFRMGLSAGRRPRYLKVHLVSSHVQKAILRNVARLKQSDRTKHIFVRRSLSDAEQTAYRALRVNCDERNRTAAPDVKFVLLPEGENYKLWRYSGCTQDAPGDFKRGGKRTFFVNSLYHIVNGLSKADEVGNERREGAPN